MSGADNSFYVHQHIKDEKSEIDIGKVLPLLRSNAHICLDNVSKTKIDNGGQVKTSFHPKCVHVKKQRTGDCGEYLVDGCKQQPFNKNGFRLLCCLCPAPITHMGELTKGNDEVVEFEWSSQRCPQISLYELREIPDQKKINKLFPGAVSCKLIPPDGIHPILLLELRETNGDDKIWLPRLINFVWQIKKFPISKSKLQEILKLNGLNNYDISALPEDAVIQNYKYTEGGSLIISY
jgi:hypothetical protein